MFSSLGKILVFRVSLTFQIIGEDKKKKKDQITLTYQFRVFYIYTLF